MPSIVFALRSVDQKASLVAKVVAGRRVTVWLPLTPAHRKSNVIQFEVLSNWRTDSRNTDNIDISDLTAPSPPKWFLRTSPPPHPQHVSLLRGTTADPATENYWHYLRLNWDWKKCFKGKGKKKEPSITPRSVARTNPLGRRGWREFKVLKPSEVRGVQPRAGLPTSWTVICCKFVSLSVSKVVFIYCRYKCVLRESSTVREVTDFPTYLGILWLTFRRICIQVLPVTSKFSLHFRLLCSGVTQ